jgi:hypothetical protein
LDKQAMMEAKMTTHDVPSVSERSVSATVFYVAYIVAVIVASVGWVSLLLYFAMMLLGL